jgi:2-succinyl-6-hydroxy-2,4-cyclohexadiene-1-carboxylate synthase
MQDLRVKVDRIELQIREYEREGDAIIFLHFGGRNLMMWRHVVPYFQDRYRLILVDLRGHGKSDKPETGYHIDEMARDVVGVMEHLKIERAHIVGSSLGAEVGLSIAAHYPDKVISLVCEGALYSEYGPFGIWEGSEAEFREYVTSQLEKVRNTPESVFPSVDALVDARRQAFEKYGGWNENFEAVERYDACQVGEGKYMHSWRNPAKKEYLAHYFECRFEDYYRRVNCPLLMLPDEQDLQSERARAAMKGLKELSRQGKIVQVSGWVHPYGWLLNSEEMCKTILEFLAEVRS